MALDMGTGVVFKSLVVARKGIEQTLARGGVVAKVPNVESAMKALLCNLGAQHLNEFSSRCSAGGITSDLIRGCADIVDDRGLVAYANGKRSSPFQHALSSSVLVKFPPFSANAEHPRSLPGGRETGRKAFTLYLSILRQVPLRIPCPRRNCSPRPLPALEACKACTVLPDAAVQLPVERIPSAVASWASAGSPSAWL